ncbi:uncharacterized protein RCO7_11161 [Rhynchosporium graminicola]|uniref:Uncharacterized protein n=1 Tax=Rhynchosporium graminicola TaxID=2792576 RepID=A0A1E1K4P6_9HELO|nr:uncharacterized protein RCO7_11161 [Rhynchosporium commune]
MSQKSENMFLAAYLFSEAPTAKFLAQHLDAAVTYVNQIPHSYLLARLLRLLFSHHHFLTNTELTYYILNPAPRVHSPSIERFSSLETILGVAKTPGDQEVLIRELRKQATVPLPKSGQRPGHAMGFFEQGTFIGAGLFLSIVLPSFAYEV